MLYQKLFPKALTTFQLASYRSFATMASAVPPQNFTLDPKIFNPSLYSQIRDFWFQGLPEGSKNGNDETMKRWWGMGRSQDEGQAIDKACEESYRHALESIGPKYIALPTWKSYSDDEANAKDIAAPFLAEIQKQESSKAGNDTLLSLSLLLDQIPRNIYRDPNGLRLVYNHYDRLAWTLRMSAPLPLDPYYASRPVYNQWINMALMHAEDLSSQKKIISDMEQDLENAKKSGDEEQKAALELSLGPARKHIDIIEKFGRFPHRNECLGRENTEEEKEWLKTGDTFGVKQNNNNDNQKSEL